MGDKEQATAREIAAAFRARSRPPLQQSLDDPREGTILTVAREAAAAAERAAADSARHRRVHAPPAAARARWRWPAPPS